jgi:ribonucleoside-diphosphate reductase alpha chain
MTKYERPEVLEGYTKKIKSSCGAVFVILNQDNHRLREVGIIKGKSGCCNNLLLRVISLLLSKLLQSGLPSVEIKSILEKQFEGNCGNNLIWVDGHTYHSCIDYIFKSILEDMTSRGEITLDEEKEITLQN